MTDKELLELAAKAMGRKIKTKFYKSDGWCAWWHHVISKNIDEWCDWNPHTDNADAFELAVKLQIDLNHGDEFIIAERVCELNITFRQSKDSDPEAATRRAIVRAAAEIGRRME
jgi:hypothetical protein